MNGRLPSAELLPAGTLRPGETPMRARKMRVLYPVDVCARQDARDSRLARVNLDTWFVTCIPSGGVDHSDQPLAAEVFAVHPGVRGLPEPKFRDSSIQPVTATV